MTTHVLKTWPEYFQAVLELRKTFEIRYNDREFEVGDVLKLREWDPPEDHDPEAEPSPDTDPEAFYTGRQCLRRVTYVLHGGSFGIQRGYVILGIT